jgi:uracil-DNA glycosylase family 4
VIAKPDSCKGCPLYGGGFGFVGAEGAGKNGVLVVLEAAGEQEVNVGRPTVGKAGQYLWGQLQRVGLHREDFAIHNVLSCRPPNNALAGMHYEQEAIDKCRVHLDATIVAVKPKVILALGRIAFKRLLDLDEKRDASLLKTDYYCYPFWSEKYQAYVVAAMHPSYLMRGNHAEVGILQFAATRAVEIAEKGLQREEPTYLLDPDPLQFAEWAAGYEAALTNDPDNTFLSFDIETPYKQEESEDDITGETSDYTILRCSFAYRPGDAVSVRWSTEYLSTLQRLFASGGTKLGWNSLNYDLPRIRAAGIEVNGTQIDGMWAWHVLNSALPKGLGFVTPFYWQDAKLWKHLSKDQPALYNAIDADAALRCWLGIQKDLHANDLWKVFDRHLIQVSKVFDYMTSKGLLFDTALRGEIEKELAEELARLDLEINAAVPLAAKELKPYKKTPKDTTGLIEVSAEVNVSRCCRCLMESPKADHFRTKKQKVCSVCKESWKKRHEKSCLGSSMTSIELNPCCGAGKCVTPEIRLQWAKVLPFKLSKTALERYQKVTKQRPVFDRRSGQVTYDEKAILKLMKAYPKDLLYPLILDYRGTQKLLGTYIGVTEDGVVRGGMPVGSDGRVHTTLTSNPSTLRSASQNPNLQNLPRPKKGQKNVRDLFIAEPGSTLYAIDYSGIEAVLVGYYAEVPDYIRLAKMDVHSYYTAWALHELEGKIKYEDLPKTNWSDDDLRRRLAEIKVEFKEERNNLFKHLIHAGNFYQSPKGAQELILKVTGKEYPVKQIQSIMEVYFGLFPGIRKWQYALMAQADRDGYLRNAFGYIHRFNRVFDWELVNGKWEKRPGAEANKVVAFLPQSTAAGIIKEAMLRLYQNHFDSVGQFLRLLIHDELMFEVPDKQVEAVATIAKWEMEQPIPELPLPDRWGMGTHLNINTEDKRGLRWGLMQ